MTRLRLRRRRLKCSTKSTLIHFLGYAWSIITFVFLLFPLPAESFAGTIPKCLHGYRNRGIPTIENQQIIRLHDTNHNPDSSAGDQIRDIRNCERISDIESVLRLDSVSVGAASRKRNPAGRIPKRKPTADWNENITVAVLKRTTQLWCKLDEDDREVAKKTEFMPIIFHNIGNSILSTSTNPTTYNLAECLISLSLLEKHKSVWANNTISKMEPLARHIWNRMEAANEEDLRKLPPRSLVLALQAAQIFGWFRNDFSLRQTNDNNTNSLIRCIYQRLSQGDALSQMKWTDFSVILSVVADASAHCDSQLSFEEHVLVVAVLRRLRKQKVRSSVKSWRVLLQPFGRCRSLFQTDDETLSGELRIAVYTLIKDLLRCSIGERFTNQDGIRLCRTATQAGLKDDDPIINDLLARVQNESLPDANLNDLSSLSSSMYGMFHDSALVVRKVGVRLLEIVDKSVVDDIDPILVNSILRLATLQSGRNPKSMEPFIQAARLLFQDEDFLVGCNERELSNFVWFSYSAHWYDEQVLLGLADRILDADVSLTCSPKLACRILSSFTSLFTAYPAVHDEHRRDAVLDQLFEILGEHLLSSQLSPLDISSAIQAYAKVAYHRDMGIVDHLVSIQLSQLQDCSPRQLAQTIWACGRLYGHENDEEEGQKEEDLPPHLSNALNLATVLADKADLLNAKDVSQSLWAMGRLEIRNDEVVRKLCGRAEELSTELSNREIANILWALSKVRAKEFSTVYALTRGLSPDQNLCMSSQEASNILYALGRLDIRDEAIFGSLSEVLMKQIESASAQSIANVLWAHRAVHINPPQRLLDSWAIEKLGIVPVQRRVDSFNLFD